MRLFEPEDMKTPSGAHVGELEAEDGVRLRYARWDATGTAHRGTVGVLTGVPETIEQYFETVNDLRGLGFAVAIIDWRSQGGSERPLRDTGKVHIVSSRDYRRDFVAFVQMLEAECAPPYYCLAHSVGGLICLDALAGERHCFERAVTMAPVMPTSFRGMPDWLASAIVTTIVNSGFGSLAAQRFLAGQPTHPDTGHEHTDMSDDPVRSLRYRNAFLLDPSLVSNQRTYAWGKAFARIVSRVRDPGFGGALDIPLMITHGTSDHLAPAEPLEALIEQLPNATYFEIPEARHIVLHEKDEIRSVFWNRFNAFLP